MSKEELPDLLPQRPGWWARLRRLRDGQVAGDTIAAQIGEDARNVVVGKNVIQIGSLAIPFYLAVTLAMGAVLVTASAVVLAVSSSGLARFWAAPARMTGQFNIAVANFGVVDARGRVQTLADGRLLSKWVFDSLQQEVGQNPLLAALGTVQIWHDSPDIPGKNSELGTILGDSAQARASAAGELAETIGAHMVIYGNLDQGADPPGLVLEFYLSPQLQSETSAVVGGYTLGRPAPLPLPFDANNPLSSVAIGGPLRTRAEALLHLTIGLTYDQLGRVEEALAVFRQAEQELTGWEESDGKEILYYFIGREALFLQRDDEAEDAFRTAIEINPHYARAQIGLGSVLFLRAQQAAQPGAGKGLAGDEVEPVVEQYARALAAAEAGQDALMASIARLALAQAQRLQGEIYYREGDLTGAQRQLEESAGELNAVLEPLAQAGQHRLLAQAQQSLGAAYFVLADVYRLEGDAVSQRTSFMQAGDAYARCVEQGELAPFDEILRNRIIAATPDGCQAKLDEVNRNLQPSAGGG